MALGNLNCAILMRNELFGRFLYLFVNTCFAKVNKYLSQCFTGHCLSLSIHHFSISGHPYGGDLAARLFFRYIHPTHSSSRV
jgi:hypothetical protein